MRNKQYLDLQAASLIFQWLDKKKLMVWINSQRNPGFWFAEKETELCTGYNRGFLPTITSTPKRESPISRSRKNSTSDYFSKPSDDSKSSNEHWKGRSQTPVLARVFFTY